MKNEETVFINFAKYDEHENELYYDEQTLMKKNSNETFISFVNLETTYKHCHKIFSFNNKLHFHLRHDQCIKKTSKNTQIHFRSKKSSSKLFETTMYSAEVTTNVDTHINTTLLKIIESSTSIKKFEYETKFRNWNFLETLIQFFIKNTETHVCIDIECNAILENKNFIKNKCLKINIHTMIISLKIRNIDATIHETNEYVRISVYFSNIKNDKQILAQITKKIHLVNDLKANLLIDNDFFESKDFTLNISNKKITIISCDVTIDLTIRQRGSYVRKNIHVAESIIILFETKFNVAVKFSVLIDRDFLFESIKKANVTLFHHIVDVYFSEIMIRNDSFHVVKIPENFCLKSVIELTYDDCFLIAQSKMHRIMTFSKSNRIIKIIESNTMFIVLLTLFTAIKKDSSMKKKLSNDIMTYENNFSIAKYTRLIEKFSNFWRDEKFINVFENQWMTFSLKNDWQSSVFEKFKIYSLNFEDQKIVNETFDDLHRKKRLK